MPGSWLSWTYVRSARAIFWRERIEPVKSIKSKAVHAIASRPSAFSPRITYKYRPIRLRELPHWLLAMSFVLLSAADFKPMWIFDEPLEHFSQPAEIAFPLRMAKMNLRWFLIKVAAGAAQIREDKICHPNSLPHSRRTPSAIEAC